MCVDFNKDYLSWEAGGIGRMLVFLGIQGIVYFALLLFFESRLFRAARYLLQHLMLNYGTARHRHLHLSADSETGEDDDVASERCHVLANRNAALPRNALSLVNVTKYYGSHLAVDRICLAVERNECFGLLGVNGAGKTTTFKMLVGDENISEGEARLMSHSIKYGSRCVSIY